MPQLQAAVGSEFIMPTPIKSEKNDGYSLRIALQINIEKALFLMP